MLLDKLKAETVVRILKCLGKVLRDAVVEGRLKDGLVRTRSLVEDRTHGFQL